MKNCHFRQAENKFSQEKVMSCNIRNWGPLKVWKTSIIKDAVYFPSKWIGDLFTSQQIWGSITLLSWKILEFYHFHCKKVTSVGMAKNLLVYCANSIVPHKSNYSRATASDLLLATLRGVLFLKDLAKKIAISKYRASSHSL